MKMREEKKVFGAPVFVATPFVGMQNVACKNKIEKEEKKGKK